MHENWMFWRSFHLFVEANSYAVLFLKMEIWQNARNKIHWQKLPVNQRHFHLQRSPLSIVDHHALDSNSVDIAAGRSHSPKSIQSMNPYQSKPKKNAHYHSSLPKIIWLLLMRCISIYHTTHLVNHREYIYDGKKVPIKRIKKLTAAKKKKKEGRSQLTAALRLIWCASSAKNRFLNKQQQQPQEEIRREEKLACCIPNAYIYNAFRTNRNGSMRLLW